MARISYGSTVQKRVKRLFRDLLFYANESFESPEGLEIQYRWLTDKQVVFRTKRRILEALTARDSDEGQLNAAQVREALNCLERFLKVLTDNETSKGSEHRHFTLTLWSDNPAENLQLFDGEWQRRKGRKPRDRQSLRQLPHQNLPPQDNEFIGREKEIKELLKVISLDYRAPYVTVNGIGGVGKTALVLEAAYRCWEVRHGESSIDAPRFDAIVFVSAKENKLMPEGGLLWLKARENTLQGVFRKIANTLKDQTITKASPDEQSTRVNECLARQKTLLIVDNLETVEEPDEILSFLYTLPGTTKAIVTTRDTYPGYSHLSLDSLPKAESIQLIKQQAKAKETVNLTDIDCEALADRFGGIPMALVYAVGQLAIGGTLREIVNPAIPLPKDIARFCFESSVEPLRGQPAHKLLMAVGIFPKSPVRKAIVEVAGLDTEPQYIVKEGLETLAKLSLIRRKEGRFKMLPLTREYALAELAAESDEDFAQAARNRWVNFYQNFARENGGKDWTDWGKCYKLIESESRNLLAVLYWCAQEDRYAEIRSLWSYLNHYTSLCGHWEERLFWLNYLITASKERGEVTAAIDALSEKSYTLILMGKLKEAETLLSEAWQQFPQLSEDFEDKTLLAQLAQHWSVLHVQQESYQEAEAWLNRAECLLTKTTFGERERARREIAILCLRAEIRFLDADYSVAQGLCEQVVSKARQIGWSRKANDAEYWLAEIAIAQHDLLEAESLLKRGLEEASLNHYQSRIALYQAAFARLEDVRGKTQQAYDWANKAKDGFERLGMRRQAEEMRLFTQGINVTQALPVIL
ncbi:MAG: ATP-binding protein [Leptolyngbya sp. SIO1E4]|nr:ATP-binding protein [Leptolyngbya sp. SIO1E4]